MQASRAPHPAFWSDAPHPVCEGGDETKILLDMLLANQSDRDDPVVGVGDGGPEHPFQLENAFGVVPQGSVPKVSRYGLALVEPVMERLVVLDHPTPLRDG